jgi:hypothetical protein
MITSQREQYGVTVHLFIGTGRSLGKITFMSLTFTVNHRPCAEPKLLQPQLRSWSILLPDHVFSYHAHLRLKPEASCDNILY